MLQLTVYSIWEIDGVKVPKPNERVLKIVMSPETTGTKELTLLISIISPNSTTGSHTHDVDEIMYIAHGRGLFISGGERVSIQTDQVVYAAKGQVHEVKNTSEETLKLICVFYPPIKTNGYLKKAVEAALGKM